MAADMTGTLTAGVRGVDDTESRPATYLFLVIEGARPTSGGARYRLDDLSAVHIGRAVGTERTANVETGDGGTKVLVLRIPDRRLSSKHARLQRGMSGWVIIDTGSKNGTVVDGKLADRTKLRDGARIEAGQTAFLFRDMLVPDDRADRLDMRCDNDVVDSLHPAIHGLVARMNRAAPSRLAILLQGETGTGKEVMARAIHRASGRQGELVAVNCGALATGLVESALFGHCKGAFTGADRDHVGFVERADGGTLFLDEIGDLPLPAQVALLRVLNEREVVPVGATRPTSVDFRLVTATHRDLDAMVEDGSFRQDLMGRITGFRFMLPPLRERREDMGVLMGALLRRLGDEAETATFTMAAVGVLLAHDWPRNVRELEAALSVAHVLAGRGSEIDVEHVPEDVRHGASESGPSAEDRALRRKLVALLEEHKGNVSAIARATGKARMQIQRWLKRYKLDPSQYR